ncbi:uncharacterized protein LOC119683724 [Teleopsis dalmanni]|uniref:uncharacterized protein LOC119683724 n=1 Tax=Teleopsis dalmanni TaxID=139649 RepID=UPI0018CFC776|nr:uncharacterized protein LOC119683724 [Teleopsis dalmanni]
MAAMRLLAVFIVALALTSTTHGSPVKRISRQKSARQVEATTPSAVAEKTPYPAAGFRPKVPFELPNERQPKAVPEPTTSTTAAPIEDFGFVVTTTQSAPTSIEFDDEDNIAHTPADTYGAPEVTAKKIDATVENAVDGVSKPAEDFQPPNSEPVEDFGGAPTVDAVGGDAEPVADVPVSVESNMPETKDELSNVDIDLKQSPAETYGPPELDIDNRQLPAETYGAPTEKAAEAVDEVDEQENELVPANTNDGQFEVLSRLSDLKNGRLIFVPADGTNLRQIYFAELDVPQRTNGRLVRML